MGGGDDVLASTIPENPATETHRATGKNTGNMVSSQKN